MHHDAVCAAQHIRREMRGEGQHGAGLEIDRRVAVNHRATVEDRQTVVAHNRKINAAQRQWLVDADSGFQGEVCAGPHGRLQRRKCAALGESHRFNLDARIDRLALG